ncbi:MAG: tRNA (adenosine(37)-N6)-threonylcarbamoyltransferase complex ATPase subunit type 1 TsaE [Candidatus Staskawiczbacteria bacterium]|nr:tRNA (adenosine(37)-N6)-threonylcarbamoyltransferase complex ATPase subunit type 1 TsaE [Candidatus Staskawiczbacteria bacterium]
MDKKYITKSYKQTQKLGLDFAKEILKLPTKNGAVILGLQGNLGGGKTTFLQGFAKGLGIKEKILSPTFVILKHFKIKNIKFKNFYHLDCYRLKDEKDILELDFKNIISNPENIVAIEWPEKIKKVLPKNIVYIDFKFIDGNKREIIFKK